MSNCITRQILGQKVALGDLFNAYKDVVIADCNIFDSGLPEDQMSVEEEPAKTFATALTDLKHDKFVALGVSAGTAASVAVGACTPMGASGFVSNFSSRSGIQQVSAICTVKTKEQTLILDDPDELKSLVNLQNLETECENATHVVVGVQRGARLAVTLRGSKDSSNDTVHELKRLVSEIERCFTAKEIDHNDVSPGADLTAMAASYEVKANVDFTIKTIKTTTYKDVCQYAAKFDSSREKTNMPLSVQLMPIKDFIKLVQLWDDMSVTLASFESVEERLLRQIVEIMDEIGTAKKTFNDLVATFKVHPECVPESQLDKLLAEASIETYEKKCMIEIRDALVKTRGGIKPSKLRGILDAYVSGKKATSNLNANLKPWAEKITVLAEAVAAGARVMTIQSLSTNPQNLPEAGFEHRAKPNMLTGDVYAFYVSADGTRHSTWNDTKRKAFEVLSNRLSVTVVIVDLDVDEAAVTSNIVAPCLELRRDGKTVISDIIADEQELSEECLIRCNKASLPVKESKVHVILEKRLPVAMACPHENCSQANQSSPKTWMCPTCKEQITFGFVKDENHYSLYCWCGSYDIGLAEFRCNDKTTHGTEFVSFPTAAGEDAAAARTRLRDQLIQMKPFEQFNILILGQTGAGKSTLINGIINYLLYDTLQDALQADQLSFAVPGSFSFEHEKIAKKTIHVKWGSENPTESFSNQGQSATQSCVIYAVNINGRLFRFVDTPGLGDTRGIDQDHKNVADIMRVLESLNTISSILFVIKNNESRLTASFDFVLTELMMHLHKDTIKNIMFCFTYGRTSSPPFAVGTAAKPLIQLLTEKKLPLKLITDQNAFVIDAEGFLHAAAWQQNHVHMMKDMNTISDSWLISAEKTRLLINVIMTLPVHDTGETLGLERNRRLVEGMSMTMVSMTEVMAITKENVNAKIKEITELEKAGKAIDAKQMQYEVVSIVDEKLDYPRTVCKGDGCAVMKADPNITGMATLVFEKSCHEPCSINAPEARFGVRELGGCWCFADEGSDCNECRHPFTSHCHISYRQVIKRETKTNEYVKREKEENDMRTTRAEMWKAKFKEDEDQIVSEEKQVRETMAKFSIYLGENSVTAYNDGVVEHLKYLMDNAKAKGHTDQRDKYAAQIAAHKALIAEREKEIAANQDKALTDRDIQKLLGELKELPMYGASFRELLNRKDAQVPYQSAIPVKISKSGSRKRHSSWMGRKW